MRVKLGEIVEQVRGVSYKPENLHDELNENSIILLRANNIKDGLLNFDDVVYVDKKKVSEKQILRAGDILVCASSGSKELVGKAAYIPNDFHATFGAFCKVVRPKIGIRAYIGHYFNSPIYRRQISEASAGANINNIRNEHIDDLSLEYPDEQIQHNVVSILDKVSDLIAMRKKQLQKLDDLVKSRFIELFGDPFNNKKWDTQKLRNISVSISDGSNVDKTYYEDEGDVLFLRIQNVWFNEFRLDDSVYISEDVNNEYLDTSLHHGDLLITKIGRYYTKDSSLGRVSVYLGEDDKANYSNNIMRVRLTDEVCSEFVNILMNLDDYNRYIREVSVGGTDKRALSKAIIGDLPIMMPPKELQLEFLEFVRQIDKSKSTIQQSLDKLELLKKALMQKYFG